MGVAGLYVAFIHDSETFNNHAITFIMFFGTLGKQIKQMLAEHGTFAAMEIQLKKIHQKEKSSTVGGGWCSETFLRTEKGWDKPNPQYLSTMHELVNL